MLQALCNAQAPVTAFLRPAQWLGFVHGLNRAHNTWTVPARAADVANALAKDAPFLGYSVIRNDEHAFKAFFFTKAFKWLDIIEFTFSGAETCDREQSHVSSSRSFIKILVVSTSVQCC